MDFNKFWIRTFAKDKGFKKVPFGREHMIVFTNTGDNLPVTSAQISLSPPCTLSYFHQSGPSSGKSTIYQSFDENSQFYTRKSWFGVKDEITFSSDLTSNTNAFCSYDFNSKTHQNGEYRKTGDFQISLRKVLLENHILGV